MSKRYIDTDIWHEDWYHEMPVEYKMFWIYVFCKCDHGGIFKPNIKMFNSLNETKINLNKALRLFNTCKQRVRVLNNGRWFIEGFIPFQQGKKMNLNNRVHKSIHDLLIQNEVKLDSIRPQVELTQGVIDIDIVIDKSLKKEDIIKGKDKIKNDIKKQWDERSGFYIEKYPNIDYELQLKLMNDWVDREYLKAKKRKDWNLFIQGWLSRSSRIRIDKSNKVDVTEEHYKKSGVTHD